MPPQHPTRPLGPPVDHDPLTCGLGAEYCPGCAANPPDPTAPPWGESLTREYVRILEDWDALDKQDRAGIPKDRRDQLAAGKLDTFGRAAGVRARAVNDVLTLLRWANEDAPGHLADAVRDAVRALVGPDLDDLARAVVRLEERVSRSGRAA